MQFQVPGIYGWHGIATGQNSQNLDMLFTGKILGHKSDIADGSLRAWEFRKFENLVGDYYVSPRFLDTIVVSACCRHMLSLT